MNYIKFSKNYKVEELDQCSENTASHSVGFSLLNILILLAQSINIKGAAIQSVQKRGLIN